MTNLYKTALKIFFFALLVFNLEVDNLSTSISNYQIKNIVALNTAATEIGCKATTQYPCQISGPDGLLLIGRGQPYMRE